MIEFTKEEISLCKQVAEKHRKDIEYGDWYWSNSHNKPLIAIAGGFKANEQKHFGVFKIWTISDCLEFLRERAFYLEGLCQVDECEYECDVSEMDDMGLVRHTKRHFEGKTPLEACLKAVLAVLEEKK